MRGALFIAAAAVPALAAGQQQVVRPPVAQYWLSAETAAGMAMPGLPAMLPGLMGGQAQAGKRLHLQPGSQTAASAPRAEHEIPPGLEMGVSLPLLTPERGRSEPAPRGGEPGAMERPKGRMLLYWGCGEAVRPGQPVVIDFAKVADGQVPAALSARRVAVATPPAPGRSRTYGDWPNAENGKPVPPGASLKGGHVVKGNYSPEIRFALAEPHDFMERAALAASGGRVQWKAIPGATGYFATLFGGSGSDEVVMWSSSETQEMGSSLMDYVPPAEVARLVKEKVVLAPTATECTVPAEVVAKAGAPLLNFIAYGPEANFAHPPRPGDPRLPWEPQWTVKARFKSTASLMLGEGAGRHAGSQRAGEPQPPGDSPARQPGPADAVEQGIRTLRGIFGR